MKKIMSIPATALLLASCSFIPSYTQPDVEVPVRWKNEFVMHQGADLQIPAAWWTLYQDDTLNSLMSEALTQNLDLRAGFERINQARSSLRIAGANLLPSASASMGADRTRTNPAVGRSSTDNNLSAGLAISYDLDLFGANKSTIEAARANLRGQEYEQEALKLVALGDIANAYFNILSARERVRIAEGNLKNSREILRITQVRVDTGLDSDLELAQQRVAVSSSEAALATIRQQESIYENALAVLLGRAPQSFNVISSKTVSTYSVPEFSLEQPSILLERRPDIHVVEQSLIAANANIGAARAAFFPSITLGGNTSIAATSFGDPATTILALTSSLAAPLFTGGRLEGGLDQATSRQRELIETYRKTVLVAFREVEDALAATRAANDREMSLKNAVTEARRAYDISRQRYEVGTIDFQTMLDTQAALLNAEDTYAQALTARLTASVDLVKSLGGGWSNTAPTAVETFDSFAISPQKEPVATENITEPESIAPAAGFDNASDSAIEKTITPQAELPVVQSSVPVTAAPSLSNEATQIEAQEMQHTQ